MNGVENYYMPDQWVLSLSGVLGVLTVITNLVSFIRAFRVRLLFQVDSRRYSRVLPFQNELEKQNLELQAQV